MRYLASKSLLALAAALVPGMAQAQGQFGNIGSYSPPTINPSPAYSPYLNLNRPGNVAQNYFGLVQPQMQAQRNFQQINQALSSGAMGTGDVGYVDPSGQFINYFAANAAGLSTGHRVAYFNYSHYYNFQGLRSFPGGPSATAGYGVGGVGGLGGLGGVAGLGPYGGFNRGGIGGTPFFSGVGGNTLGGATTSTPTPFFFVPSSGNTGIGGTTTSPNP